MSDMVQQPVIQLVQELTMTAVVERHDCTDTKKEEKSRSPRPHLNTNNAFVIPPFLPRKYHLSDISGQRTVKSWRTSRSFTSGGYPKTISNTSKRCWWAPSQLVGRGGGSPSPPWRRAGEKECSSCIQTGPTQLVTLPFIKLSSDTSEICWH